jgi:hypothetical protein
MKNDEWKMENGPGSNQNSIRPVTLITRFDPATVPRIRPKVLELMLRSGLVKYGVLVRLNASDNSAENAAAVFAD